MKKSIWAKIPTLHYQTRNMPCKTLNKMNAIQGMLGRNVSKEMVLALALEFGLGLMESYYVQNEISSEEVGRLFRKDFRLCFREEVSGDE